MGTIDMCCFVTSI